MQYDPKLDKLIIDQRDLKQVYFLSMYALKHLRLLAGLPLDRYEREGPLTNHDFAAIAIIENLIKIGVHLEITPHQHNKLDLRDIGD